MNAVLVEKLRAALIAWVHRERELRAFSVLRPSDAEVIEGFAPVIAEVLAEVLISE